MTVAKPGDVIATEAIGHHTLLPLASYLGLRLKPIAIDEEGIIPYALEDACLGGQGCAAFVMPSATNPTVGTMSEERWHALAGIARRFDLHVIENDAWGPLTEDCPPPIAAIAPERTLPYLKLHQMRDAGPLLQSPSGHHLDGYGARL